MMSYLYTKFHDNWISSFRGVVMTRFWDVRTDRRTDGVTALLDLLYAGKNIPYGTSIHFMNSQIKFQTSNSSFSIPLYKSKVSLKQTSTAMHGTTLLFHIYILPRNCYEVSNIVYGTCTCKFTLCDLLTPSNITMHFVFKKRYKTIQLKPLVVAKCSSPNIF